MRAQIAPLDRPSLTLVASRDRLPSSCRSWIPYATGRMSRMRISPNLEMNSRTTSPRERFGRTGMDADSIVVCPGEGGEPAEPAHHPIRHGGLVGLDHLVEHQLPALGGVSAVVAQRGVAVGVDVVDAKRALATLGREERVDHG